MNRHAVQNNWMKSAHWFDLSPEINLGVSFKCKLRISHYRMKQVLNKFRTKWCLSSYFSLPAKLLLIRSGIFASNQSSTGAVRQHCCILFHNAMIHEESKYRWQLFDKNCMSRDQINLKDSRFCFTTMWWSHNNHVNRKWHYIKPIDAISIQC